MRQTLFYIPHSIGPLPVFGIGWLLLLVILVFIALAWNANLNKRGAAFVREQFFVFAAAAALIVFLLPRIETRLDNGTPNAWIVGLPVRGYGVLLMCGVLSGLAIGLRRCSRLGISRDSFFSLATWTVIAGLVGARLFYVIQKWDELERDTVIGKLYTALQFTEGGLVVYGSVIGGLAAIIWWAKNHSQPLLRLADAITPAFFIGLAFGRIGCLLNGCCYGGVCEAPLPSITFPVGSPAYMDQLYTGRLLGLRTDGIITSTQPRTIESVDSPSWAASESIHPGQTVRQIDALPIAGPTDQNPLSPPVFESTVVIDSERYRVPAAQMPHGSLPVHPSQIYASVSAAILCLWTLSLSAVTNRIGVVFGSGLIAYGFLRIIEEIVRVDELGQFGTSFSIAQWISALGILLGIALVARGLSPRSEVN